ncbi:MAG: hypothetical protein RIR97_623 [Pseudomonadota bacterium]|jgi:hypothetical protein
MKSFCSLTGLPPYPDIAVITSVDLSVDDRPHPFFLAEQENIARNWQAEQAAQPALYNGEMLLHRDICLEQGHLRAVSHLVPFSTFLWWRKQPGRIGAAHLFSLAVPISSDGAIIAIRMGDHTANPGKVYCAAGSLDRSDIAGSSVDIDHNMAREFAEETGLDLSLAKPSGQIFGLWHNNAFALFRPYSFSVTAADMLETIRQHVAHEDSSEIAEPLAIWSDHPTQHAYASFMPPILTFCFQTLPERKES